MLFPIVASGVNITVTSQTLHFYTIDLFLYYTYRVFTSRVPLTLFTKAIKHITSRFVYYVHSYIPVFTSSLLQYFTDTKKTYTAT